jgi:hypothetical protein
MLICAVKMIDVIPGIWGGLLHVLVACGFFPTSETGSAIRISWNALDGLIRYLTLLAPMALNAWTFAQAVSIHGEECNHSLFPILAV